VASAAPALYENKLLASSGRHEPECRRHQPLLSPALRLNILRLLPEQPWLDGFAVKKNGVIRQHFAPLDIASDLELQIGFPRRASCAGAASPILPSLDDKR